LARPLTFVIHARRRLLLKAGIGGAQFVGLPPCRSQLLLQLLIGPLLAELPLRKGGSLGSCAEATASIASSLAATADRAYRVTSTLAAAAAAAATAGASARAVAAAVPAAQP
jgi:hypothetical protein